MPTRRSMLIGAGAVLLAGAGAAVGLRRQMGSLDDYAAAAAEARQPLGASPDMADLVRFATLAANSHNSQPWRFRVRPNGIDILPDTARRLSAVDPDDHHLFASLGCAAENLTIAAGLRGRAGVPVFAPAEGGSVTFAFGDAAPADPALLEAIPLRQSTRGPFDGVPISPADLALLQAATVEGVDLVLVTERAPIDRIRDLVIAGNSRQLADPAFMRELKAWLRFNPRQAIDAGDGLFSGSTGNPMLPSWLGPLAVDAFFSAASENDRYAKHMASSAGVAVFVARKDDPEHWVLAGRACQRFALQATALGIRHAFINQPVEVADLRPELAALVGLPGRRPDIVLRFGRGPAMPFSQRRPVAQVML